MTRYWQHTLGDVYPSRKSPIPESDWTEVRVAPLDAYVIERSELPETWVNEYSTVNVGDIAAHGVGSAHDPRTVALAYLAIAEHLTANPPVDRAKVSALASEIEVAIHASGVGADEIHPLELAERLIATGKVTVTTDGGAS